MDLFGGPFACTLADLPAAIGFDLGPHQLPAGIRCPSPCSRGLARLTATWDEERVADSPYHKLLQVSEQIKRSCLHGGGWPPCVSGAVACDKIRCAASECTSFAGWTGACSDSVSATHCRTPLGSGVHLLMWMLACRSLPMRGCTCLSLLWETGTQLQRRLR